MRVFQQAESANVSGAFPPVPVWNGDPRSYGAFKPDFKWHLEGEELAGQFDKVTGAVRYSVAAKVVAAQKGSVKAQFAGAQP